MVLSIIGLCIAFTAQRIPNDTFYTLKIGELILENGIDMQEHFAWHEGLPYTYPHWLYDLGIFLILVIDNSKKLCYNEAPMKNQILKELNKQLEVRLFEKGANVVDEKFVEDLSDIANVDKKPSFFGFVKNSINSSIFK